jgi:integrator complex subunit 9
MLDCSLNMKTLQHFLPQMLVQNQRFENMPTYRSANNQNGQVFDHIKEFNGRFYLNTALEFSLPEFNLINIEDLDVVLISSSNAILALPYLTKMKGFRAMVYCTEPVLNFGRMLMEELVHYVKPSQTVSIDYSNEASRVLNRFPIFKTLTNLAVNLSKNDSEKMEVENGSTSQRALNKQPKIHDEELEWKQNYTQFGQLINLSNDAHFKPLNWKYLYTKENVDQCISKIKVIEFNQGICVYGSVNLQAKSSGYSIGSCNWLIESDSDTFCYLTRSSLLNTHSKLFDQSFLKNQLIDTLLLTGLNHSQLNEPETMIQDFCKACILTLKNQGNVLIPIMPTGKIYDLIEYIYRYLSDATMTNVPVYFISSVADQSFAFSNIFAEWLCDSKQNLVHAAESPFQHAELVKNNLLKIYPSINSKFNDDFHQPCIVFASHPSLRFGEACHFVEMWKNSPNNSFIFIDSEFNYIDALAPFQPVYANYYYFPIDTSLTTNHLNKLLKEPRNIGQIVTSSLYKTSIGGNDSPENLSKLDHFKLSPSTIVTYYQQNDIVKLIIQRKYEDCDIESDLAQMLMPTRRSILSANNSNKDPDFADVNTQITFCKFDAHLHTKDAHHTLKATPKTIPLTKRDRIHMSHLRKYPYGRLNFERFLSILRKSGSINAFKILERDQNSGDVLKTLNVDKDTVLSDENLFNASNLENFNHYTIEIDEFNRIDLDLSSFKVDVNCDNDEYRIKVKDTLLKCLKTL